MLHMVDRDGRVRATLDVGAPFSKVVGGKLDGTGRIGFVAATEDGFLYGDIK
jgi:hypothetical protein